MLIGELAEKTGLSHDTIRYYEKIGLYRLRRRDRRINGFKEYPEHLVERLNFVQWAKAYGFTLSEIREILEIRSEGELNCEDMEGWAQDKVKELADRIEELKSAKGKLEKLLKDGERCGPEGCDPVKKDRAS